MQSTELVFGKNIDFEAKGRTLIYQGWLKLVTGDQTEAEEENDSEPANPIPILKTGQRLNIVRRKLLEKKTKPPSRYTEATLVKKLESEGIGRPATYAAIMDNIVSRAYVRSDKKYLVPTETGELIVDSLAGKFAFMDMGFTRDIENELDEIAHGKTNYKAVIVKVHEQLQRELTTMQVSTVPKYPCPSCGKSLRRIRGVNGFFWGCSGYPNCSVRLPDDNGKPGQKKPQEVSSFSCLKCGKPLIHRTKKGNGGYDFWSCSGFKDGCKESYDNKNGMPDFEGWMKKQASHK